MNIFVLRKAALGDFVLTLPVIDALTTMGRVHVATHPRFAALLPPGVSLVDDDWVWTRRRHAYDLAITFSASAAEALRVAGVPEVRHVAPRPPPGVHALDHYAGVLDGAPFGPPRIVPTVGEEHPPFVVIAPGSGGAEKRWPIARWRAVAEQIPAPVVWVRGPVEVDEPRWPDAEAPDVAGLIALAARSAAWLGPDAGPSHLAAAVYLGQGRDPARASVVFGPTDPSNWAPLGAQIWPWNAEPHAIVSGVSRFLPIPDAG